MGENEEDGADGENEEDEADREVTVARGTTIPGITGWLRLTAFRSQTLE